AGGSFPRRAPRSRPPGSWRRRILRKPQRSAFSWFLLKARASGLPSRHHSTNPRAGIPLFVNPANTRPPPLLYDRPRMRDVTKPGWPLEPVSADLRRLIDACAAYVVEHVDSLPEQPSFDVDGAADLASTFDEPAPDEGRPIEAVLARLGPAIAKSFTTA